MTTFYSTSLVILIIATWTTEQYKLAVWIAISLMWFLIHINSLFGFARLMKLRSELNDTMKDIFVAGLKEAKDLIVEAMEMLEENQKMLAEAENEKKSLVGQIRRLECQVKQKDEALNVATESLKVATKKKV